LTDCDLRPHSESLSGGGYAGGFVHWGASVSGCGVEVHAVVVSGGRGRRGALDRNEIRSSHCKMSRKKLLSSNKPVFTFSRPTHYHLKVCSR